MLLKAIVCNFMILFTCAVFAENLPQIVTSEFFQDNEYDDNVPEYRYQEIVEKDVPAWPLVGSDADVQIACKGEICDNKIKIDNRIGNGWSGGPNIMNNVEIPAGFDNDCYSGTRMPLFNKEMMEDDGGSVLSMSRSSHTKCHGRRMSAYPNFVQADNIDTFLYEDDDEEEISVGTALSVKEEKVLVDDEKIEIAENQVRSWVVTNGQTLREVLSDWCDREGWDLVWTTSREYPIEASAVFKGRFIDVASALIRNFERATPIPYARFYKGNRVIVVSSSEE